MNFPSKLRRSAVAGSAAALLATASLGLAACGGSDDETTGASTEGGGPAVAGGTLDIVGYSTPEAVYTDALEPGFQETPEGAETDFANSFGASGDQRRAVEAGQPASIVHFAQGGDMIALEETGDVAPDWDKNDFKGIAQESVVVITTRGGNPENIKSFDDLLTKDIDIITPNPLSSGAARWNIMAIYGSQLNQGKSETEALDAVRTVLSKAVSQPGSARDALALFTSGEGDVLLGYENEAIKAQDEGEDVDFVIPPSTIRIQTPIAVTADAPENAQAFLDFIWSDEGQQLWSDNGYRPVNQKLLDTQKFPVPKDLFSIDQFGGWEVVTDEFFDEATGKVAQINEDLGVPSE